LNEEARIPSLLDDLTRLALSSEVLIADGRSTDGTRETAAARGVRVLIAPRGRARQMNAGAAALRTPWLWFLHADSRLPDRTCRGLERWLREADVHDFATFDFSLEGDHWFWRFIEFGQRVRERVFGLAYGDQGLLLSRILFESVGGFSDLPLMEDVDMLQRLRRRGRWRKISQPLVTSPRRYQVEGRWRAWLRNSALITLFRAGVSPARLARAYLPRELNEDPLEPPPAPLHPDSASPGRRPPPDRQSGESGRSGPANRGPVCERTLLVFAKAPLVGWVKTRLAADIGEIPAERLYRAMGRQIVDGLRGGEYRLRMCFDPPEAHDVVKEWVGEEGIELLPQGPGDLGQRMEAAFREAFRDTEAVVVVGTDAPDVDRSVVEEAFARLGAADLVLGPATDGGYYLLGLNSEAPQLFRGVPWSTAGVMAATLQRARASGLTVAFLPLLSDVDTLEDLRRLDGETLSESLKPGGERGNRGGGQRSVRGGRRPPRPSQKGPLPR
jgi:rSAM/selenodomain-associated transferase 2/rSAM/selenodomain-associated transferase 1